MASEFDGVLEDENGQVDETPHWYILKCQVNREDRCKRELDRRVAATGLDKYILETIVPVKYETGFDKNRKPRKYKVKMFPGYIMVKMVLNDQTWFLMRETPGIGDFVGTTGKPMPLQPEESEKILAAQNEKTETIRVSPYHVGDEVRIVAGDNFKDYEGEVIEVDESGLVTVKIVMLNTETSLQFETWQIEKVNVE